MNIIYYILIFVIFNNLYYFIPFLICHILTVYAGVLLWNTSVVDLSASAWKIYVNGTLSIKRVILIYQYYWFRRVDMSAWSI